MWANRRQARSRGAVRTVSLAGAVAVAVICSLTVVAARADALAAVPSFEGPATPNGAAGSDFGLGTDLSTGTDSSASESLSEYYSTHPLIQGDDEEFGSYTHDLTQAYMSTDTSAYGATVENLAQTYGGNSLGASIDVAHDGINLAVTGDVAGGDAVISNAAAALAPAGASDATLAALGTAVGTAGVVGLTVGAIGVGLKWEWGHFGGDNSAKPDTYYTVAPTQGAVLNANLPCGFTNLYTNATARPCTSNGYRDAIVSDKLLCANGPCSVSMAAVISIVGNGESTDNRGNAISAHPILSNGLPGESLTIGYSGHTDPGDLGSLDRDASTPIRTTEQYVYNACDGGSPYQCDIGTQWGSADTLAGVPTGITATATGVDLGPSHSETRWMSYRERCFEPGQNVFAYLDFRGPSFDWHDAAGAMTGAPCPVDSVTSLPGNLVGLTVLEMPTLTPLVVWQAPAKFLDTADPYYRCNAGNMTGNPCQVQPRNPSQGVTPDTGSNPCTYGGTVIAEADCVAADQTTWTVARTTARGQVGSNPAPYSGANPEPMPSSEPSPAPTGRIVPGQDPITDPAVVSGQADCFPSGWAVFNPLAWVYKPVKCALIWAFVPSDAELQTDTDGLQSTFDASTLGQGATAVGNVYAGFASVPAGGCQGPGFDVSRVDQEFADAHATYAPLETCDGLGQKVSDFARPWFVAGIWLAVAFSVYYVISKSIGAPD